MEGTETGFTESLILEEQRLSARLLAIRNLIKLYDNNLESEPESLGMNTKYPMPSTAEYFTLLETLHHTIWDVHSHSDYKRFVNTAGQVINYYYKHPDVLRKEIPDIEWDIPLVNN